MAPQSPYLNCFVKTRSGRLQIQCGRAVKPAGTGVWNTVP